MYNGHSLDLLKNADAYVYSNDNMLYTMSFSYEPRKKIQDTWCAEISLGVNAKIVDLEDLGHLGYPPRIRKPRQVKLWRPALVWEGG